ncbi:UDP binding domain-containing protein [Streptomyces subrutilus]|uniref:UDP binding domain-containing protein n=1 Tax=Streptomyces subrutilus TaxID=36818 RepID=UPI002E12435E|nr:UDP-glucose/GDP-mannose dehydrogenase family protein [Streptomyces subrutilus]
MPRPERWPASPARGPRRPDGRRTRPRQEGARAPLGGRDRDHRVGSRLQARNERRPRVPGARLRHRLQKAGAAVTVHDPQAVTTAMQRNPELEYTANLTGSVIEADAVVLATEWPEYQQWVERAGRSSGSAAGARSPHPPTFPQGPGNRRNRRNRHHTPGQRDCGGSPGGPDSQRADGRANVRVTDHQIHWECDESASNYAMAPASRGSSHPR